MRTTVRHRPRRVGSARVEKEAEASLAQERAAASPTAAPTVVTGGLGGICRPRTISRKIHEAAL